MTPDEWTEDDGPRFEKLRHNRKYHGHGGRPHKPALGMHSATRVGLLKVVELVSAEKRKANKAKAKSKRMVTDENIAAIRRRYAKRRGAREQEAQG